MNLLLGIINLDTLMKYTHTSISHDKLTFFSLFHISCLGIGNWLLSLTREVVVSHT